MQSGVHNAIEKLASSHTGHVERALGTQIHDREDELCHTSEG